MQVNRIQTSNYNNQPQFGMKYINPRKWNGDVLDSLRNSSLTKEIDAKYPNAKAWWLSKHITGSMMHKATSLLIKLSDNTNPVRVFHNERSVPSFYKGKGSTFRCCHIIKNTSLADLEKKAFYN